MQENKRIINVLCIKKKTSEGEMDRFVYKSNVLGNSIKL